MDKSGFFFDEKCLLKDLGEGVSRKVLAHNEAMLMAKVVFQKGACGSVHTHPHTQCTYVDKGRFEFTIDGESKTVKEGDSLIFSSDTPHGCICLEEGVLIDVFTPCRKDFLS